MLRYTYSTLPVLFSVLLSRPTPRPFHFPPKKAHFTFVLNVCLLHYRSFGRPTSMYTYIATQETLTEFSSKL